MLEIYIDDQCRGPSITEKGHLVGQLTNVHCATQSSLEFGPKLYESSGQDGDVIDLEYVCKYCTWTLCILMLRDYYDMEDC